jgi:hypothetical protein
MAQGDDCTMAIARGRRWPWGRIVAGVVATVILGVGVNFLIVGAECRTKADAAKVAEPIRLAVDLSKPGVYTGRLHHTFVNAHSNYLEIVTDSPLVSPENAQSIVEGLTGQLTIRAPQGAVVTESTFGPEFRCIQLDSDHWTPIIDFGHFAEGDYDLDFTVNTGAAQLVGVRHSLVGRYRLCGMEYMPAGVLWLLGIAGCVVFGLISLVVAIVTVRKNKSPCQGPSN